MTFIVGLQSANHRSLSSPLAFWMRHSNHSRSLPTILNTVNSLIACERLQMSLEHRLDDSGIAGTRLLETGSFSLDHRGLEKHTCWLPDFNTHKHRSYLHPSMNSLHPLARSA
jgi:hypothetical protein